MVYRVYVEKKAGQTHEADSLLREIKDFLQIAGLTLVSGLCRQRNHKTERKGIPWYIVYM